MNISTTTPLSLDLTVDQVALACHHDPTLVARLVAHAARQADRWSTHERECQSLAQFDAARLAAEQAQTWTLIGAKFVAVQRSLAGLQAAMAS